MCLRAVDTKGIQLVRRDNCPLVKDVSTAILDAIMYAKDPQLAVDTARQHVAKVLAGDIDIDKFVVSKTLRGGYKNDKQPHVYVAAKIRKRRGRPVNHGERVPYVFVEDLTNPDALQAEKAEDPSWVREHGLQLDRLYYVERQLHSPIVALLELLVADAEAEVFGHSSVAPTMQALKTRTAGALRVVKRLRKNASNHQAEITSFFKSSATAGVSNRPSSFS